MPIDWPESRLLDIIPERLALIAFSFAERRFPIWRLAVATVACIGRANMCNRVSRIKWNFYIFEFQMIICGDLRNCIPFCLHITHTHKHRRRTNWNGNAQTQSHRMGRERDIRNIGYSIYAFMSMFRHKLSHERCSYCVRSSLSWSFAYFHLLICEF